MSNAKDRPAGNGPALQNGLAAEPHHSYTIPVSLIVATDNLRERTLIAECLDRGIRVAVQCKTCARWLVDPVSVAAGVGPKCATKAVDHDH